VSLQVRSTLLDGEGVFSPKGYQPRDSKPSSSTPPEELHYIHMLNHQLPEDIRVLGWCPVSEDFSARYDTTLNVYIFDLVGNSLLHTQLIARIKSYTNFFVSDVWETSWEVIIAVVWLLNYDK